VVPTTDWLGHPFPSRLHHIFEKIAEHHEVHVLRFTFYPDKKLETKLVVHEINDTKSKNLALYYVTNAHKHFSAVYKIARENRVDVVVISNLLAGFVAAEALSRRFKTIFDLSDHFPSSGAGYYFDVNSIYGKLATLCLEKILKATLKCVDSTVTCSSILRDYVKNLGIGNVCTIPNGVDDFFFSKNDGDEIRQKYGLDGCVTVGYIGSIEFWVDMFPLLKAIEALSRSYDVKLMLVGGGLRTKVAQQVYRKIRSLRIEKNVVWIDFVPYCDVPSYIASMDICTIPFSLNSPTAYYSAPNKLLEYLALEKAVITTLVPEIVLTAKPFVNFATTSKDYMEIIEGYIRDRGRYLEKAKKGRSFAMQLTWDKIAQKYENLLSEIADNCK